MKITLNTDTTPLAITAKDLRARLGGISISMLHRLIQDGELTPLFKPKHKRLFAMADVEAFLARKRK